MIVREFTRVFQSFPFVDEATVHTLEQQFINPDGPGFLWDCSNRNPRRSAEFIRGLLQYDFGLATGQVSSLLTTTGTRMIIVGTALGNVVLHERQRYSRCLEGSDDATGPSVVLGYFPDGLQIIMGSRPLRDEQIYQLTGFFNTKDNIGFSLNRLANELRLTA